MEVSKDDVVAISGSLKKVCEFLSKATKEDLRVLSSFFVGDAKGPVDARRLLKPLHVTNVYAREGTIEVELTKNEVWEEKSEYFQKLTPEEVEKLNGKEETA